MRLFLSEDKVQRIGGNCRHHSTRISICNWKDVSSMSSSFTSPLYIHQLQQQLIQTQRKSPSLKCKVALNQGSLNEAQWWIHNLQQWNGRDIIRRPPDLIIQSDASLQGSLFNTYFDSTTWWLSHNSLFYYLLFSSIRKSGPGVAKLRNSFEPDKVVIVIICLFAPKAQWEYINIML